MSDGEENKLVVTVEAHGLEVKITGEDDVSAVKAVGIVLGALMGVGYSRESLRDAALEWSDFCDECREETKGEDNAVQQG